MSRSSARRSFVMDESVVISEGQKKDLGQEEVEDEHRDRCGDDGRRRGATDTVGAARGAQTVVTGDQGDRESEEERLPDSRSQIVVLHRLDHASNIEIRV